MWEAGVVVAAVLFGTLVAILCEWQQQTGKEEMNRLKETVGSLILEAAESDERSVVNAFKIKTITGFLGAVRFAFSLIGNERVKLVPGVEMRLGPQVKATLIRAGDEIRFYFQPGPTLVIDAKIAKVRPELTGLVLRRDEVELKLDGLPDVRIGLE